jgi:hypothetical protein
MRSAIAAITAADVRELTQYGVPPAAIEIFQLIGIDRVSHLVDCDIYEPDPDGAWAFITPVLVQDPVRPESMCPEAYVRFGDIVDLVAWDPARPRQWALRAAQADWIGLIPPQYLSPDAVPVRRSVLDWLKADCSGIAILSRDQAAAYRLLMSFPGGIEVEDDDHLFELEQILARPWPVPRISIRGRNNNAAR